MPIRLFVARGFSGRPRAGEASNESKGDIFVSEEGRDWLLFLFSRAKSHFGVFGEIECLD